MTPITRGMSLREIRGHLKEIYQIEVSPEFISSVTDSVMEDVREWQNRPLDSVYPILYWPWWKRMHAQPMPSR